MLTNITNYLRYSLYAILIFTVMFLFQAWDKEHPKSLPTQQSSETIPNNYVPEVTHSSTATAATPTIKNTVVATNSQLIHITTDLFDVNIDTLGGNITQIKLLKYPQELHSTTPFTLLNNSPDTTYIAQSGLLSTSGPDTSKGQVVFTPEKTQYTLEQNENELRVNLFWLNNQGLKVTKTFIFQRNSYEIGMAYKIDNQSKEPWEGNLYLQLMRKNTPSSSTGLINLTTYFGAAISSADKPFQKISFKEMQEKNINQSIKGGWAAMIQHYFVSAWIPNDNITSQYFSRITNDGLYTIGTIEPKITVNPNTTINTQAKLYAGPSIANNLEKAAPGLQLTIDYGWFWFIAMAIFWMMQKIHSVVGNWGWSIILVTLVIKLIFYHLSAKSYRSMSVLKKLQPQINMLKERYGEDKQKFTQATLELYKKEKVNPMSGCLPILIQIPVFIGLYWVLIESVELRQAPFILWIQDLTQKDPYYVLPLLMGLSMFLQQRLNPPPPDPMQAKIMMLMPVIFTVLFINFPAGLMLYWFVNNTLSFLQQWYIMRSINGNHTAKK